MIKVIKFRYPKRIHFTSITSKDDNNKIIIFNRLPNKIKFDDEWNCDFFKFESKYGIFKSNKNKLREINILNSDHELSINIESSKYIKSPSNYREIPKYFHFLKPDRFIDTRIHFYRKSSFERSMLESEFGHIFKYGKIVKTNEKGFEKLFKRFLEDPLFTYEKGAKNYKNIEKLIMDFNQNWEGWDDGIEIK